MYNYYNKLYWAKKHFDGIIIPLSPNLGFVCSPTLVLNPTRTDAETFIILACHDKFKQCLKFFIWTIAQKFIKWIFWH